jgi:nucleoside-diphosphate-sugar epimerase
MNSMTDKPLCAITGAGGYVGGCLKDYFTRHGWEILELTRQPKPGARAVAFQLGAEISPSSLAGVTALVHCAYDFKPLRWEEIRAVNVEGTRKILSGRARGGHRKKSSAFPPSAPTTAAARFTAGRNWKLKKSR